ncbi:MAG: hypothetical protein ABIR57_11845 [Aeromicrobium sp.]
MKVFTDRPLMAVISIALVAISLAGCGDNAKKTAPTPTVQTTKPTPTAAQPTFVDYAPDGVAITKPSEVDKLVGAPQDFIDFIAAEMQTKYKSEDAPCTYSIGVMNIDPSGFASGSFSACSGANLYWAKVEGKWKEAFGTQMEGPPCTDLKKYRFPIRVAGKTCLDDAGKEIPYDG